MQREVKKEAFRYASKALEVIIVDVFAKNGWRHNNRLFLGFFLFEYTLFLYLCQQIN